MNCDWVRANIVLYVYDELADDSRYELERHVQRCAGCAAELQSMNDFKSSVLPPVALEPSPNLLAASRMRLQEALETVEPRRGWRRLILEPTQWLHQLKLAPALVTLIFMVGFGAGVGASYRLVSGNTVVALPANTGASAADAATSAAEASIIGINAITHRAGSKKVDINYNTLVPQSVSGSVDDPHIQQLLLFAARNNSNNSGVRMDSVNLLTQNPEDQRVREALMYALSYDNNPGVRLKALQGLEPYVKADIRVRNAVLDALLNDSNPGVRTEAVQMLRSVRADASVQQVLKHLAGQDQNISIRNLSRSLLASTPPID